MLDLSKRTGIPAATIQQFETGSRRPGAAHVARLAYALSAPAAHVHRPDVPALRPQQVPREAARRLQGRLARLADAGLERPLRRVHVAGLLADLDVLRTALRAVVGTRTEAAGSDGVTLRDLTDADLERMLAELQAELQAGAYGPRRLRRTWYVAGGKRRSVAVLCVRDRIVQRALLLILEAALGGDIPHECYLGRPGGVAAALKDVRFALEGGKHTIIKADIAACFDEIDLGRLMRMIAARVTDPLLLDVLRRQLARWQKTSGKGVCQGGPLSPFLANFYLSQLDRDLSAIPGAIHARYMDDLLVLVEPGDESSVLQKLEESVAGLGLRLNEEKTSVVRDGEEFQFLGLTIRGSGHDLEIFVSPDEISDRTYAAYHPEKFSPEELEHLRNQSLGFSSAVENIDPDAAQSIRTAWSRLCGTPQPSPSVRPRAPAPTHPRRPPSIISRPGCQAHAGGGPLNDERATFGSAGVTRAEELRAQVRTVPNHDLGRRHDEVREARHKAGAELQLVQEDVGRCRAARRVLREQLLVDGRFTNREVDGLLRSGPRLEESRELLRSLRERAQRLNQQLGELRDETVVLEQEMAARRAGLRLDPAPAGAVRWSRRRRGASPPPPLASAAAVSSRDVDSCTPVSAGAPMATTTITWRKPPSRKVQRRSMRQARDTAAKLGAVVQPASGARPHSKADVWKRGVFKIEQKLTKLDVFPLKLEDLEKIRREAAAGELPVFDIMFVEAGTLRELDRWGLIPWEHVPALFADAGNRWTEIITAGAKVHGLTQDTLLDICANAQGGVPLARVTFGASANWALVAWAWLEPELKALTGPLQQAIDIS